MEDYMIIQLYLQRSEQAIIETERKYSRYCHSIASRILGSDRDAEEIVNDTYMGAWNSIPPNMPESLSAYIGKITRYLALTRWKADRAQKRGGGELPLALEELEGCISSMDTPEKAMEAAELTEQLNRFLSALPQTEQRVFVCRYWYLLSVDAIAQKFGFSQSKVKSMLSRTRGKLRKFLKKEEIVL